MKQDDLDHMLPSEKQKEIAKRAGEAVADAAIKSMLKSRDDRIMDKWMQAIMLFCLIFGFLMIIVSAYLRGQI